MHIGLAQSVHASSTPLPRLSSFRGFNIWVMSHRMSSRNCPLNSSFNAGLNSPYHVVYPRYSTTCLMPVITQALHVCHDSVFAGNPAYCTVSEFLRVLSNTCGCNAGLELSLQRSVSQNCTTSITILFVCICGTLIVYIRTGIKKYTAFLVLVYLSTRVAVVVVIILYDVEPTQPNSGFE